MSIFEKYRILIKSNVFAGNPYIGKSPAFTGIQDFSKYRCRKNDWIISYSNVAENLETLRNFGYPTVFQVLIEKELKRNCQLK